MSDRAPAARPGPARDRNREGRWRSQPAPRPRSCFAWSAIGVALAAAVILSQVDDGAERTCWLLGLVGAYLALLAVASLAPHWNFYLPAIRRGPTDRPWVALTFDDGPDPAVTPALLDLLRQEGIVATFFCVGESARRHPALVARAAADGHLIGNHSDHHGYGWAFASAPRILAEFAAAHRTLTAILGAAPRFVRTPAGISRPGLAPAFRQLHLTNVGWDVRGLELFYRSPERIAARIARRARNGSIILLHETDYGVGSIAPQRALATARLTIAQLRARGFRFVRLDQLLKHAMADAHAPTLETGTRTLSAHEPHIANDSGAGNA